MPIYEYQCECGEKTSGVFPLGQFPETVRCACGKRAKKIVSHSSFLLKGQWPSKELTFREADDLEHKNRAEYLRRRKELEAEGADCGTHYDVPKEAGR